MTQAYDIIGDIHGYTQPLEVLLAKLGYQEQSGVYQHPQGNKVCFLGDFIDRGPQQKRVIEIIRNMMDNGHAISVMGNHEFNAICYAKQMDDGTYLRKHNPRNEETHKAFLEAYPFGSAEHAEVIEWFKTLPVYIDNNDFVAVHACWDERYLNVIQPLLDKNNCLTAAAYDGYAVAKSPTYKAIECLMKGPEYTLPAGATFQTHEGTIRNQARIKWWADQSQSVTERLFLPLDQIDQRSKQVIDGGSLSEVFNGHAQDKPIFIGHYWLTGKPNLLADNIACLDYSVPKSAQQVAYSYRGEDKLTAKNFVI
jgi:hypothetical protein